MSGRAKRQLKLVQPAPPQQALSVPAAPRERGFFPVYRIGQTNPCPGCERSCWHVGRSTAECAFCATALPIVADGRCLDLPPEQ